jgi:hypothetical protein
VTDHEPGADPASDRPDEPGAPVSVLDAWLEALATELGVDPHVVDVPALLDAAGEAARCVGRPAAPVTAFLIGYAAGQGPFDVSDAVARTTALADRWLALLAEIDGRA